MLNTQEPHDLKKGGSLCFHKIMVAYDDSPEAGRALRMAIELATALQAELSVVTVLEPLPIYYSFAMIGAPAVNWTEERRGELGTVQFKPKPSTWPRPQA